MKSNNEDMTSNKKKSETDKNTKSLVTRISETIRFHEWIDRMDQKDQKLDPAKRKKKWTIILCASFILYLISFFVFPKPAITYEPIQPVSEGNPDIAKTLKRKKSLSFEMPVDSFETILKQEIHEMSGDSQSVQRK